MKTIETPIKTEAGESVLANSTFYVGQGDNTTFCGSFYWHSGSFSYLSISIQNDVAPITEGSCVVRVGVEINNETTYTQYTLSKSNPSQAINYTEGTTLINVFIESTQGLPVHTLLRSNIIQTF